MTTPGGLCNPSDLPLTHPYSPIGASSYLLSNIQPQGEGPVVVIHSYTPAHERLGTNSIARVTASKTNTTANTTVTANLVIAISLTSLLKWTERLSLVLLRCVYEAQPTPLKQSSTSLKCSIFVLNVIKRLAPISGKRMFQQAAEQRIDRVGDATCETLPAYWRKL